MIQEKINYENIKLTFPTIWKRPLIHNSKIIDFRFYMLQIYILDDVLIQSTQVLCQFRMENYANVEWSSQEFLDSRKA